MKILYNGDTKRLPEVEQYDQLVALTAKLFQFNEMVQLGENVKFYYVDSDGDIISITNQNDLTEAYSIIPKGQLRLIIAKSIDEAKEAIGVAAINRSQVLNSSI